MELHTNIGFEILYPASTKENSYSRSMEYLLNLFPSKMKISHLRARVPFFPKPKKAGRLEHLNPPIKSNSAWVDFGFFLSRIKRNQFSDIDSLRVLWPEFYWNLGCEVSPWWSDSIGLFERTTNWHSSNQLRWYLSLFCRGHYVTTTSCWNKLRSWNQEPKELFLNFYSLWIQIKDWGLLQ